MPTLRDMLTLPKNRRMECQLCGWWTPGVSSFRKAEHLLRSHNEANHSPEQLRREGWDAGIDTALAHFHQVATVVGEGHDEQTVAEQHAFLIGLSKKKFPWAR